MGSGAKADIVPMPLDCHPTPDGQKGHQKNTEAAQEHVSFERTTGEGSPQHNPGEQVANDTPVAAQTGDGDPGEDLALPDHTGTEYFRQIGLQLEPFSTSPDPVFFYASPSCTNGLQRLEVEVRLRRGLNLVLGEVGMGKTTMARVLVRRFQRIPEEFVCRLLSDPRHADEHELLTELTWLFEVRTDGDSILALRNALRNFLFEKALEEGKAVVLIVDEGQALSGASVQVLRHLLNFETNDQKLLQLVIFGQPEFQRQLQEQHNFADRINFGFVMRPFDETATREMIAFRLNRAGLKEGASLFTDGAMHAIHLCAEGVPRRITMLCHDGLMAMLSRRQKTVDETLISLVAKRRAQFRGRR